MQTSITNMANAIAGMWANLKDIDPDTVQAEGSPLRFGAGVVHGTNDKQGRLPDANDYLGLGATTTANEFVGVVVFHGRPMECGDAPLAAPFGFDDAVYIKEKKACAVATQGAVYVLVETAVIKGEPAFIRHTLNDEVTVPQLELLGAFRNDDDTATAALAGSSFFGQSGAAGSIVKLEIRVGASS